MKVVSRQEKDQKTDEGLIKITKWSSKNLNKVNSLVIVKLNRNNKFIGCELKI